MMDWDWRDVHEPVDAMRCKILQKSVTVARMWLMYTHRPILSYFSTFLFCFSKMLHKWSLQFMFQVAFVHNKKENHSINCIKKNVLCTILGDSC